MKKQLTDYKKKTDPKWLQINADGQILGRLASEVAKQLMGKNSANYTPSVDTGDHIIIYNAEKIVLKGNKINKKIYYRHSGYPGGLKSIPFKVMIHKKPDEVLIRAIRGMLPKTRLGRQMLKKVRIIKGETTRFSPQNPTKKEFKTTGVERYEG